MLSEVKSINSKANHHLLFLQDDAISTRGDGLERVSYKIGDLGHVAPVTSSGANPEVSPLSILKSI